MAEGRGEGSLTPAPFCGSDRGLSYALVFPGQGAHYAGMAAEVRDGHADVRVALGAARRVLGRDLLEVMGGGFPEDLARTRWAQPAILLHEISAVCSWNEGAGLRGLPGPSFAAGHSLGEYAALYAAGSLPADTVMGLVCARARAMSEACEAEPGGMSALIGLSPEDVAALDCVREGRVWVANQNSTDQVVVAGGASGLAEAEEQAARAGARKVVRLQVEGAFHSPHMRSASRELSRCLARARVSPPAFPVACNATGGCHNPGCDPDDIRRALALHVVSPVRWVECVRAAISSGAEAVVELGPRSVVSPFVRKIASQAPGGGPVTRLTVMSATGEPEIALALDKLLELTREVG